MVEQQICTAAKVCALTTLQQNTPLDSQTTHFLRAQSPSIHSKKRRNLATRTCVCVRYLDLGVLWYIEIPVVSIHGRRMSALDCSIASYWVSNVASMEMDVNGAGCYSSRRISLRLASMDLTTFVLIRASAFSGRPCSFHPWQCQPHNAFFHSLSIYLLNHQQKFEI